mgnify:CR=1 FL=1
MKERGGVDAKSCFFLWIWTKLGTYIFHLPETNTCVISYRKTNPEDQMREEVGLTQNHAFSDRSGPNLAHYYSSPDNNTGVISYQ